MKTLLQPAPAEISLPRHGGAADPVRVAIVRTLAAEGKKVCGTFEVGVSKATRSHRFRVLREAGLTNTRLEGSAGTCRWARRPRRALPGCFDALLAAASADPSGSPSSPSA